MRLAARVQKLEATVRPVRRTRPVPDDPVAFARGLLAGTFGVDDLDPTDPDQTGWLVRLHAFLDTLGPEHQEWLRGQRQLHPRAYPDAVLLPATDEEIWAALDEVMRRG